MIAVGLSTLTFPTIFEPLNIDMRTQYNCLSNDTKVNDLLTLTLKYICNAFSSYFVAILKKGSVDGHFYFPFNKNSIKEFIQTIFASQAFVIRPSHKQQ